MFQQALSLSLAAVSRQFLLTIRRQVVFAVSTPGALDYTRLDFAMILSLILSSNYTHLAKVHCLRVSSGEFVQITNIQRTSLRRQFSTDLGLDHLVDIRSCRRIRGSWLLAPKPPDTMG